MIGRQINFYLSNDDLDKIENYLKQNNFKIISYAMPTPEVKELDSLKAKKGEFTKFVVQESQIENIKSKFYEARNEYVVDIYSPLIQFSASAYDESANEFRRGRLYYVPQILTNENWQFQNEDFLKSAEKLFRWFKRNFKKIDDNIFYGFYASDNVVNMVKNHHAKIIL